MVRKFIIVDVFFVNVLFIPNMSKNHLYRLVFVFISTLGKILFYNALFAKMISKMKESYFFGIKIVETSNFFVS